MPALNFKKQFAIKILEGKKRQSIRVERKRPIKMGDKLFLYTGMRTDLCYKLYETTCKKTASIEIREAPDRKMILVFVNGYRLTPLSLRRLAEADGFEDIRSFIDFFRPVIPFKGQVISW